jgi:hypothetical protein
MDTPPPVTFLVFGDLHGRVLPAFRFGSYWSRRARRPLAGLLQVGDMGYFPDPATMDKATIKHAKDDHLELGTLDVVMTNPLADKVFEEDADCPPGLWFTAGNHEDFAELERLSRGSGRDQFDFVVDAYCRVRGVKDGRVMPFECGLKVGAVWGVDGDGPHCRKNLPKRGYIDPGAVDRLAWEEFDVLLSHDAPLDAKREGSGSAPLRALIEVAKPRFAFFGHYGGDGSRIGGDFGPTEVYHLAGFELRTREGHPESGSVGVLEQTAEGWAFDFIPDDDLKPFTRHNWKWV